MFLGSNKPSRKELEQKCRKLTELVESQTLELSNKERHIKRLTENLKKWSDKFNGKAVEPDADTNGAEPSQLAEPRNPMSQAHDDKSAALLSLTPEQNEERKRMQDLLVRSKVANSKLVQLLTKLQQDVATQNTEMELLKNSQQNQHVATKKKDGPAEAKKPNSNTEKTAAKVATTDDEPEFSMEMQQTLAKYADTN